jgi:hypothetical protein
MASSSLMSILDYDVLSLFTDEQLTGACLEYLEKALSIPTVVPTIRPSPVPVSSANPGGGMMMCLASVLDALAEYDERTIFSVRKINKLGFKSYGALKKHFSNFGVVEAIYFLPYRYKPDTASIRPSSMAFIRMASRESVDRIFAIGETHIIREVPVTVQPYRNTTTPQ